MPTLPRFTKHQLNTTTDEADKKVKLHKPVELRHRQNQSNHKSKTEINNNTKSKARQAECVWRAMQM